MTHLVYLSLIAFTGYTWFWIGRRVERGQIEIERDKAEEVAAARSRRVGTVRLNVMKIRR